MTNSTQAIGHRVKVCPKKKGGITGICEREGYGARAGAAVGDRAARYRSRGTYRPFQSDREWEWPLRRESFELLEAELTPRRLQGYLGREMYAAITCTVLPVRPARRWVERARQADTQRANRLGRDLYRCNTVTMWWQKAR